MSELSHLALRPRDGKHPLCPFCRALLGDDERHWECPSCGTSHHLECASENERCAIHGCGAPAPVVKKSTSGRIRVTPRAVVAEGARCLACNAAVGAGEEWRCTSCGGLHHSECAENLDRCAGRGCQRPFAARARIPGETSAPSGRAALRWAVALAALALNVASFVATDRALTGQPGASLDTALLGAFVSLPVLLVSLFGGEERVLGGGAAFLLILAACVVPCIVLSAGHLAAVVIFLAWLPAALLVNGLLPSPPRNPRR